MFTVKLYQGNNIAFVQSKQVNVYRGKTEVELVTDDASYKIGKGAYDVAFIENENGSTTERVAA